MVHWENEFIVRAVVRIFAAFSKSAKYYECSIEKTLANIYPIWLILVLLESSYLKVLEKLGT
jgi:cation transporter-like permease